MPDEHEPATPGDTWSDEPSAAPKRLPPAPPVQRPVRDASLNHPSLASEQPGRYTPRDVAELGRGGLGRVIVAFDAQLGREIAVKELLSPRVGTDRFLREARVTAQLEHPNIVPVYELGRREDGTLYYTMKRVRGRTLADLLATCQNLAERLEQLDAFVATCNAVAYAHSRGVVHRDLKHANVMVGQFGETVLLDWGLAKAKGQQDLRDDELARNVEALWGTDTRQTLAGATMGTPAYMSPEQADGRIADIDERSDVWSLGAMLFEILTGVPPFAGRSPREILDKVKHLPAPRADEAPDALANICAKALARDPADRYASAEALAADVRAWQAGGRVAAHRYSAFELAQGFASRNRVVLGVALLSVTLAGGLAAFTVGRAERARTAAEAHATTLAAAVEARVVDGVRAALRRHDVAAAVDLLPDALPDDASAALRGAWIAAHRAEPPRLEGGGGRGDVTGLAWAGDTLAASGAAGVAIRRGAADPEEQPYFGGLARGVALLDDGRTVVGESAGALRVASTQALVAQAPDGARVLAGAGALVLVAGWGTAVDVIEPSRRRFTEHTAEVRALATDGVLAVSADDSRTLVWDPATGAVRHTLDHGARALALSPDAARVAGIGRDGVAWVWELTTGERTRLEADPLDDGGLAWRGVWLVGTGRSAPAHLWRGDQPGVPLVARFGAPAASAALAPDGTRVALGLADGWKVWSLPVASDAVAPDAEATTSTAPAGPRPTGCESATPVASAAVGAWRYTAAPGGDLCRWRADTLDARIPGHPATITAIHPTAGGGLVTVDGLGGVWAWP